MLASQSRSASSCQLLGELPGASSDSKLEVWQRPGADGQDVIELVEYSWGSGMGWYVQKRMILDAGQARALAALVAPPPAAPERRPALRQAPSVEREGNVVRLVFAG